MSDAVCVNVAGVAGEVRDTSVAVSQTPGVGSGRLLVIGSHAVPAVQNGVFGSSGTPHGW